MRLCNQDEALKSRYISLNLSSLKNQRYVSNCLHLWISLSVLDLAPLFLVFLFVEIPILKLCWFAFGILGLRIIFENSISL